MSRYKENYIGFYTILRKEITRFIILWTQTILPSLISTILYFLIFGNLIGSRIGPMNGFSYAQYIAPGLIMMAVISNAYANVSAGFFLAKFQRSIEEILISPLPNYLIILGFVSAGVIRGIILSILISIITLFFTHLEIQHVFYVITTILLTAALFSIAGLINGIFANSFDDIMIIPTFLLTPLVYLGGVFYSINMLPKFWQKISLFNPILYMIDAFRYGMLGIADINIYFALGMVFLCVVALFIFCLSLLNKGVGIRS